MRPGWTYLFEAVYCDNTHVVQYAFEGLVLLGAVAPDGCELRGVAERQHLAAQMGVMAAPCLQGPWAELCDRLSRGTALKLDSSTPSSRYEGWVVEDPEGTRHKLVQASFQRTGRVAPQLHPLSLWGMVRNCGMSRAELSAGLPPHFQRELHAILDALESQFCRVQRALAHMAAQAQAQQSQGRLCELLDGMQGFLADRSGWEEELENVLASLSLEEGSGNASDGGARSSVDEKTLYSSSSFQHALHYVLRHIEGKVEGSMFYRHRSHRDAPCPLPLLRGLVLDCIRPGVDGTLPGYSPSHSFAQTYAKGWARGGPQDTSVVRAARAQQGWGDGETIEILIGEVRQLPCENLGMAQMVCKEWRRVISGDAVCKEKLKDAAAVAAAEVAAEAALYGCTWDTRTGYGSF